MDFFYIFGTVCVWNASLRTFKPNPISTGAYITPSLGSKLNLTELFCIAYYCVSQRHVTMCTGFMSPVINQESIQLKQMVKSSVWDIKLILLFIIDRLGPRPKCQAQVWAKPITKSTLRHSPPPQKLFKGLYAKQEDKICDQNPPRLGVLL